MTKTRRLLAVAVGIVVVVAIASSRLQGQPGGKAGPIIRPVNVADRNLERELADSKFEKGGVVTYETLQGEVLFAYQLKPQLPNVPVRKRDYVIVICDSAAHAGEPRIAAGQIADGIVQTAGPHDRIALWVVRTPEETKQLAKLDYASEKRSTLNRAIDAFKNVQFPAGNTDLKDGLSKAIGSFEDGDSTRQRILLYMGDGQSTYNPLEPAARAALIQEMVSKRITFFSVPLGLKFNPDNLHGFTVGTGGAILRTKVAQE